MSQPDTSVLPPATSEARFDRPVLIPHVPKKMDVLAGILSYILPGLGQISQGRFSKGILFLVSLHVLFFYGMYLGNWKNVYVAPPNEFFFQGEQSVTQKTFKSLSARLQILGQAFIGMSAWPALYQAYHYDGDPDNDGPHFNKWMRYPGADEINRMQRDNDKLWDLGWVYTVIAGVLNILVIYDAMAGAAFRQATPEEIEKYAPKEKAKAAG